MTDDKQESYNVAYFAFSMMSYVLCLSVSEMPCTIDVHFCDSVEVRGHS